MSRIAVDKCPAGPAMDAAVAEMLTGHAFDGIGRIENRDGTIAEFCKICGEPKGYHNYDNYRRIENAWRLAEWATKNLFFSLAWVGGDEGKEWSCIFGAEENRAYAETAPLAISRAFLKANGAEHVEVPE